MNLNVLLENEGLYIELFPGVTSEDFEEVTALLDKQRELKNISIDLKNLTVISSKMIASFIAMKKIATAREGVAELLNMSDSIYQVIQMSNLQHLFNIRDDFDRYGPQQVLELFHQDEKAYRVTDYIAVNYNQDYKSRLLALLDSGDPVLQEYSIITFGKAQESSVIWRIRHCLDSGSINVAKAAIRVLGILGDTVSKDLFYKYLTSPFSEIAEAAGGSIVLLSDDTDPGRLENLLSDINPELKKLVGVVLSLINGEEAYGIVKKMLLAEKDENIRRVLVRCIAYFNKPEVTEILIGYLDDSHMSVREAAAAGLERTGLQEYEEQVLSRIEDGDSWMGYFAVKALGKYCSESSFNYLQKKYPAVGANVKLAIIEVMGRAGKGAVSFLTQKLSDGNEDIRKEALTSLFELEPFQATEYARKMVLEDPSWIVRYKAIEIINSSRLPDSDTIFKEIRSRDNNRYIQEKIAALLGR